MIMSRPAFVAALLFAASSAFALDIEFSSPLRSGPAAYDQSNPVLASNGIDYLAAWTTTAVVKGTTRHVYAAQVHADGTLAADIATQLGDPAGDTYGVSISPGRDGYFVAWLTDKGATAAVLDSYGRTERFASVMQPAAPYGHTLTAWDGSTHIVLSGFSASVGENGAYSATLLDDNANVIAENIAVGTQVDGALAQCVIADSAGFLVLSNRPGYNSNPDVIFGRRITPAGSLGEWFQIRTTASRIISIAAVRDGSSDLIAWSDGFGVWTAPFDPQTNAIGSSRQVAATASAGGLRLVNAKGVIWVAWADSYTGDTAIPLGTDGTPGTAVDIGSGWPLDLASNGQSILSIRSAARGGTLADGDIVGRFLSAPAADFTVSKSHADQENGDLASDGTTVLATWDEDMGTSRQVFAARHVLTTATVDGAGVQVSSSGTNRFPSAASNGKTWLIAWIRTDSSGTFAVARRFANGVVIDSEDIVLGPTAGYQHPVRVASNGSEWVVEWTAIRPGGGCGHGQSSRPILTRVSTGGVVLDPDGVDVTAALSLDTTDFDIAWDGTRYVAAWSNTCWYGAHTPTYYDVHAAFISADLTRTDLVALTPGLSTSSVSMPRIAAIENSAVIAWNGPGSTQYIVVNEPLSGRSRTRSVGPPRVTHTLEGSLVGASRAATGQLMLFTVSRISWAAYNGVFCSILDGTGAVIGNGLGAILDGGESLHGYVARAGGYAFMPDSRFDSAGGATRQWMTIIDSPR